MDEQDLALLSSNMMNASAAIIIYHIQKKKSRAKRSCNVREILRERRRIGHYTNLISEMRLHDVEGFKNFHRMTPQLFDALLHIVGPAIQKYEAFTTNPITSGERLSLTLRYLASGDSMVSIGPYGYRIGQSTTSGIIRETTAAIWEKLKTDVFPNLCSATWQNIAAEFNSSWNSPNCLGAIDGKHVVVQKALKKPEADINDLYRRFRRLLHYIFLVVGFQFPHRGWRVLNPLSLFTLFLMLMQPYPFFQYIRANRQSMRLMIECAATSGTLFMTGGKIIVYIINREAIEDIMELIEKYRSTREEQFKDILRDTLQYTFNWARVIYLIYFLPFVNFSVFPLLHPDPLKLPMAWGFPHIPINETYWIIHYIYHCCLVLSCIQYIYGIDVLAMYIATHSNSRFDIMIKILSDIQCDIDDMEFDDTADRKISIKLKELYIEHIQSIEFLKTFNRYFALMHLIQYMFNTFVCCLAMNVMAITLVNGMYNFVVAVLFQQFLFCFFGNKLTVKSDNFIKKIYEIDWYKLRLPQQKCLRLILQQSQRPVNMNGIFFILNYGSLIALIKTSYSYFALLQNFKK